MPANNNECPVYSLAEEAFNITSHALGALLSVIALVCMVVRASGMQAITSVSVFGVSLVLLYVTSTLYHCCKDPARRRRLRIFDHATIFLLIAGTYTPVALITLGGWTGWLIFGISWGLALAGTGLKIFFTGRYTLLSTIMYVLMGWMIIVAIKPLSENIPTAGFAWLLGGGLLYSLGAVLYKIRRIPFNHAIFHGFVMLGSFSHFLAVYFYVLPSPA